MHSYKKSVYGNKEKKNVIKELKEDIDNGKNLNDLWRYEPSYFGCILKYRSSLREYETLVQKKRNRKSILIISYGNTGTGKSLSSHLINSDSTYFLPKSKNDNGWWWNYNMEEVVIIDDFKGQLNFEYLLNLTDRLPLMCETKGGFVNFNSKICCYYK